MTMLARLERPAALEDAAGIIFDRKPGMAGRAPSEARPRLELSVGELAFRMVAAFRAHPHINNVLTHISRANWPGIEQSLRRILDPATTRESLSPLEQNVLELMCASRGVTGRILRPYFHALLYRNLDRDQADAIIGQARRLYGEAACGD
jgi:hypothetical protein